MQEAYRLGIRYSDFNIKDAITSQKKKSDNKPLQGLADVTELFGEVYFLSTFLHINLYLR